jgi:hypothetical protein
MVTDLNDFNDPAQTTNLGVRSSNLFGRATLVQSWALQNLPFLRLRQPEDRGGPARQGPLHQLPLSIGSERTRMLRDSSNTATAPPDNAGSKADKFANRSASCRAGVRLVAPRNRRSDGAASRVSAKTVAKSVSADTMTRFSSRARTKIVSSSAR